MNPIDFGSFADITAGLRHVRFAPNNGHSSVRVGCPLSDLQNARHALDRRFSRRKLKIGALRHSPQFQARIYPIERLAPQGVSPLPSNSGIVHIDVDDTEITVGRLVLEA